MVVGVLHLGVADQAPLGVWWFDGTLLQHYVVDDDDAEARGIDRVGGTFHVRVRNHPDESPPDIWLELADELAASTPSSSWWERVEVGGDARAWLHSVSAWMNERFGVGVNSQLRTSTQRRRYRFAANRGRGLAARALGLELGSGPGGEPAPVLPVRCRCLDSYPWQPHQRPSGGRSWGGVVRSSRGWHLGP